MKIKTSCIIIIMYFRFTSYTASTNRSLVLRFLVTLSWTLLDVPSRYRQDVFWTCWCFLPLQHLLVGRSSRLQPGNKRNLFGPHGRRPSIDSKWVGTDVYRWYGLVRVGLKFGDRVDFSYVLKCFQTWIISPRFRRYASVGRSSFCNRSV